MNNNSNSVWHQNVGFNGGVLFMNNTLKQCLVIGHTIVHNNIEPFNNLMIFVVNQNKNIILNSAQKILRSWETVWLFSQAISSHLISTHLCKETSRIVLKGIWSS